nr:MAG TPA: hypothetical protein [Caudoviricetes sp.]
MWYEWVHDSSTILRFAYEQELALLPGFWL